MNDRTVYETFEHQTKRTPDAIAVRDERRTLTYAELDRMAAGIAAEIGNGARFVGIVMDHGAEMIASILAALRCGAAYVPAEPTFPIERIQFMLAETDVDAVVTQRSYDSLSREFRRVFVEAGYEPPTGTAYATPTPGRGNDLAYVLYTSGTTGVPKGVSVENRNVLAYIESFRAEFDIGPGDVMLQHSVCSFDIFVEEVFSALLSGATLAIPPVAIRDSVDKLAPYLDEERVTIVDGFPYLIAELNQLEEPPRTVRLYVSGGDVLRESYCDRLVKRALVYNTYGPSETTCCATYFRVNGGRALADGTYPIGKPVKCASIEILDEDLLPVPTGKPGEICISGEGVSRGYLGERPEQENFVERADGSLMYRSGDLGYVMDSGDIAFLHRKDSQVMIDGRRVECSGVENVLAADSALSHAVVRPHRDARGLSYMVAYIVPADGAFDLEALRARLARKLADFMIPEFFVKMSAIPLTKNGKPDDEALPVVLK